MGTEHDTWWPAPPWAARWRGSESPIWPSVKIGVPQVAITDLASRNNSGREDLDALAFALLLTGPVALAWRRRQPVAVLAVTLAATEAYYLLGYAWGPAFLSLAVALWVAVIAGERLAAWLLLVLLVAEVARTRRQQAADAVRTREEGGFRVLARLPLDVGA